MIKNYGAQIVFTEAPGGGKWRGKLLNPRTAVDIQTKRAAGRIGCKITECEDRFHLVTHGGDIRGSRYRSFRTLTAAQIAAMRWAARRFKIPVER